MARNTVRLPPCLCPQCGKFLDAATPMFTVKIDAAGHAKLVIIDRSGQPKAGNWTMCLGCYQFLKFDHKLRVVKLSEQEFRADPEAVRQGMFAMRREAMFVRALYADRRPPPARETVH